MFSPCPRHILCPPGTGTDSPGVNYSSEHVDVPEFFGRYYPPTPYGYYTSCQGRCLSLVSQEDADLCAQRNAKICLNQVTTGKPTFGNTPQICTIPSTGKTVVVPADTFFADSQAEANAQALSYANNQQQDPKTPPGVNTVPNTGGGGGGGTNEIPTPVPQRHEPPPPPASHCPPCNETGASTSFSIVCNIPEDTTGDTQLIYFYSPPMKCGTWKFSVQTNDGGSSDDTESAMSFALVAANPSRTPVDWEAIFDCSRPVFYLPCSPGDCTAPSSVLQFGLNRCCADQEATCHYANCHTLEDGSHWLLILVIQYVRFGSIGNSAVKFTVNGTLLSPLPSP